MEAIDSAEDYERILAADPESVVAAALGVLRGSRPPGPGTRGLIAQMAIDSKDPTLLSEVVAALRAVTAENRVCQPSDWFNFGNVLQDMTEIDGCAQPARYLDSREMQREGRRALARAGSLDNPADATQALTNLGNWLDSSGRWAEAFEIYQQAVAIDPTNGMAYGNAALLLLRRAHETPVHAAHLAGVAARYARLEREHRAQTLRYGGPSAADHFDRLVISDLPVHPTTDTPDAFQSWVASERLALSLTVEGLPVGPAWDEVGVERLHQSIADGGSEVPALFAIVNTLKHDYLLARRLTYECVRQPPGPDTSTYADTLDYAIYGGLPAQLTLAQRASLDLLDRVAVAANEYLKAGIEAHKVDFRNFWTTTKRHQDWRPEVGSEVVAGNRGVLALADLSFDLDEGGYLSDYRELRNLGTHRFAVLHDLAVGSHAHSEAVEHILLGDFEESLMSTLRIARAAILYLVELIRSREDRKHPHSFVTALKIPDHGDIRGYTS